MFRLWPVKPLTASTGRVLEPGHEVQLLRNGRIFEALEAEIARAQVSVHIVMYIWKPGEASDRISAALIRKRREGVPVRVVVDRYGVRGGFVRKVQPRLEAEGIEVRLFRPPGAVSFPKTFARTHRKIVVIDGRIAFLGGWCIWDTFLGDGRSEEAWRDTNVRIRGPAVRFAQQAFLRNWTDAGGALPGLTEVPWPEQRVGDTPTAVIHSSSTDIGGTQANALLRALLPFARERLWIATAYFSPDPQHYEPICERARAGVDVRILTPGPVHDVPPIREAGRGLYPLLLESGVRLFEYQPTMMHAKTFVVDDRLCVVGSVNLEPNSTNMLEEDAAAFDSVALTSELARDFEADLHFTREITPRTIPAPVLTPPRRAVRWVASALAHLVRRARRREATLQP